MICGSFKEGTHRQIELSQVSIETFECLLELACTASCEVKSLSGLVELARLADLYQMNEVRDALEREAINCLTVQTCSELLDASAESGLLSLEAASLSLALDRFDAVAETTGFLSIGSSALRVVISNDDLCSSREERVLAAVARWLGAPERGDKAASAAAELLPHVRFPYMAAEFLAMEAEKLLPEAAAAVAPLLRDLAAEGALAQAVPPGWRGLGSSGSSTTCGACTSDCTGFQPRRLASRSVAPRSRGGVDWAAYSDKTAGGGAREPRRLRVHGERVLALVVCGGFVCTGSEDRTVRTWSAATLAHRRTLLGHTDAVRALAALGGSGERLASGSYDKSIRVWDVGSGECLRTLVGHAGDVLGLLSSPDGARLYSCGYDKTIRVWAVPATATPPQAATWSEGGEGNSSAGPWACEQTLVGHEAAVHALAIWEDAMAVTLLSAADDATVRAWNLAGSSSPGARSGGASPVPSTARQDGGVVVAARRPVHALVVDNGAARLLLGACLDGAVRGWALGTWECRLTLQACDPAGGCRITCLALLPTRGGGWLLGGSGRREDAGAAAGDEDAGAAGELRIWGNLRPGGGETAAPPQATGGEVAGLVCLDGRVLAAVGEDLVVWGRE